MQGDNDDGSFSADELAQLVDAGVLEVHQPGTPEHVAARQQMRAAIDVADAEALAIHGPDALTSRRLLRQEALKAERDPDRYGSAFAAWCASRGWERSDLASWLCVTTDQLAAMALERRAKLESQGGDGERDWTVVGTPLRLLAKRYGVDGDRLAAVVAG
jgi:hypothetical protein